MKSTIKNITTLLSGTLGAQLVNFIGQMIITRLYLPETLGIYTFILSIAQLVIPIGSLKMEYIIVSSNNDEEAYNNTMTAVFISVVGYAVSLIIILPLIFVNRLEFENWLFIPLMIFLSSIRFTFIAYSNYFNNYRGISIFQVLHEVIMLVIQIIIGYFYPTYLALIIGYVISPIFSILGQGRPFFKRFRSFNYFIIKKIIKTHTQHILYQVPSQFANTLSYTLITFIISMLSNPSDIAFYNFSVRILMMPLVLISYNVSKIYIKELAIYPMSEKLNYHKKISFALIALSVAGFGVLYFIAPSMMAILFGASYSRAGVFISILTLMYSLRFITSSLLGAYVVLGLQKIDFYFQILLCALGILIGVIAINNSWTTVQFLEMINMGYGIVYLANFIILSLYLKRYCENNVRHGIEH